MRSIAGPFPSLFGLNIICPDQTDRFLSCKAAARVKTRFCHKRQLSRVADLAGVLPAAARWLSLALPSPLPQLVLRTGTLIFAEYRPFSTPSYATRTTPSISHHPQLLPDFTDTKHRSSPLPASASRPRTHTGDQAMPSEALTSS